MARLTPQQRAEIEKALADDDAESAAEDDTYEVHFYEKNADGSERGGTMPWRQGRKVFGSFFPDLFGEKPPVAPDDDEGKPPAKPKPGAAKAADQGSGVVRFGRRVS